MKFVLRFAAALQILIGAGYLIYSYSLNDRQRFLFRFERPFWYEILLPCSLISLGLLLWVATRAAYRAKPITTTATVPVESSGAVEKADQPWGMASFLRILAGAQMGGGIAVFLVLLDFYLLSERFIRSWHDNVGLIVLLALVCWGFSTLGGILWAVTRIAYPPK